MSLGDFTLNIGDPPACTVGGFLPPNMWRSPEDTTEIDTPDGLYCKLPQDSPIGGVRGARNYPCMGKPGKRAPTVEICDSDKPYEPLAMHQHALGPYPIDPNLIAQGIPPDDRAGRDSNTFGPLQGGLPCRPRRRLPCRRTLPNRRLHQALSMVVVPSGRRSRSPRTTLRQVSTRRPTERCTGSPIWCRTRHRGRGRTCFQAETVWGKN